VILFQSYTLSLVALIKVHDNWICNDQIVI
jgi:hypothetical protein